MRLFGLGAQIEEKPFLYKIKKKMLKKEHFFGTTRSTELH